MYKGERINSWSHLVGAVLALAGWQLMVIVAAATGDVMKIVAVTIYGFTLFFLYTSSALYHSIRGRHKLAFQRMDHIAIYFLIAGTYTPFTMLVIKGESGLLILRLVWCIAVAGTAFKIIFGERYNLISTLIYVATGWTVLIDIRALFENLPAGGIAWVVAGGALYTVGALFYLKDNMPRNHEIWHFFVLAASICHFVAVFFYVL